MIENIEPVNAPSCYRISLLCTSLEVTARLKSVDDLDLLMNVLESNRAFFVKNDRLAAEMTERRFPPPWSLEDDTEHYGTLKP